MQSADTACAVAPVFNFTTTYGERDSQGSSVQPNNVAAICAVLASVAMLSVTCLKLYYWRRQARQPPADVEASCDTAQEQDAPHDHDEPPREVGSQDSETTPQCISGSYNCLYTLFLALGLSPNAALPSPDAQ